MPRLALALALAAVVTGCSGGSREWPPEPQTPLSCDGDSRPVHEKTLVRTLARYGFELWKQDLCEGLPGEPTAMFTNLPAAISDTAQGEVVIASDSQVWCDL